MSFNPANNNKIMPATETVGGMDEDRMATRTPPSPAPKEKSAEATSVFLSKEALGGRSVKEGDTITLRVESVDSETGDVEACLDEGQYDRSKGGGSDEGYESAFDRAMPAEG